MLAMSNPKTTGVTTRDGHILISGSAETATYIAINQRSEAIADDGSFEIDYELEAGPNTLELEVRDKAGNVDILILKVEWDYSPPDLRLDLLPERTREESILINGSTEGILVTVDGVPVPLVDGLFTVPVHLSLGHNSIDVEAFDAAGNAASHRIQIDREERLGEMQTDSDWTGSISSIILIIAAVAVIAVTVVITRGRPQAPPPRGARRRPDGRPRRKPTNGARPREQTKPLPEPEQDLLDRTPGGSSTPYELPAETTEPLESPEDDVIVDVPEEPIPKDPLAASTHDSSIPADETAYEGPMHTPGEPDIWSPGEAPPPEPEPEPVPDHGIEPGAAPELQLEFAPLPLMSVPDPTTVSGDIEVNGDGELSY
ncbi:MAG: hypothetical protein KAS77_03315, partial [Thermoplasmata archaeon]|nr:hypothetical protein [Thermoplasmata archaeon]